MLLEWAAINPATVVRSSQLKIKPCSNCTLESWWKPTCMGNGGGRKRGCMRREESYRSSLGRGNSSTNKAEGES